MAQRAFRIDLARAAGPGQERRAVSRTSSGRDFRTARPSFSKPSLLQRSLIAVHNLPFSLALRARRIFRAVDFKAVVWREVFVVASLLATVGGLLTWFYIAAFLDVTK